MLLYISASLFVTAIALMLDPNDPVDKGDGDPDPTVPDTTPDTDYIDPLNT